MFPFPFGITFILAVTPLLLLLLLHPHSELLLLLHPHPELLLLVKAILFKSFELIATKSLLELLLPLLLFLLYGQFPSLLLPKRSIILQIVCTINAVIRLSIL